MYQPTESFINNYASSGESLLLILPDFQNKIQFNGV